MTCSFDLRMKFNVLTSLLKCAVLTFHSRVGELGVQPANEQLRQTPMNKSDHNGYWAALERSKLVRLGVRNRSQ